MFPRSQHVFVENCFIDCVLDGQAFSVYLWDTAGQQCYSHLRPLCYPGTDVFLIFYSPCLRQSFNAVADIWQHEVKHFCPGVPYILVAAKIDLLDDEETLSNLISLGESPVSHDEGVEMANKIGAADFLEVSSLKGVNLNRAVELACTVALDDLERRKRARRIACHLL